MESFGPFAQLLKSFDQSKDPRGDLAAVRTLCREYILPNGVESQKLEAIQGTAVGLYKQEVQKFERRVQQPNQLSSWGEAEKSIQVSSSCDGARLRNTTLVVSETFCYIVANRHCSKYKQS